MSNRNLWSEAERNTLHSMFQEADNNGDSLTAASEKASKVLGRTAGACYVKYKYDTDEIYRNSRSYRKRIDRKEVAKTANAYKEALKSAPKSTNTVVSTVVRLPISSMTVDFDSNELVITL